MGKKLAALIGVVLAASSLFVASAAATPTPPPTNTTVVVTQSDLATGLPDVLAHPQKWFFYNDETNTIDNSLGSMVYGPGTPPLGQGSAQISVSGTQRRNLATYQFAGTKLADITVLKFSTYNPSAGNGGSADRSGYLNFNVDFNGSDTWQKRLVYLPNDNGTVQQNTWQAWDAVNGGNALYRYSGAQWPGTTTDGTTPRTLSDLIASYPGIRIRVSDPWLGVRVGEPYADGYTENIDAIVFGTAASTVTYNFEPTNQPDSKNDCRNNGWKLFTAPAFASQKDCERWVKADAHGNIRMSGPSQKLVFNISNTNGGWGRGHEDRDEHGHHKNVNTAEYWNYEYLEAGSPLHYKAAVSCSNVNPLTNDARFVFQIPAGHPGLSGLYIVAYVKEVKGHHQPDLFGFSATADAAVAQQWCETGVGFSPTFYTVTRGEVEID